MDTIVDTIRDSLGGEHPGGEAQLAAAVGNEVAQHYRELRSVLNGLAETGRLGRDQIRSLRLAAESMYRVATHCQQLARHAAGQVRQSLEEVDVADVVGKVLQDMGRELSRSGAVVRPQLRSVRVLADPALLYALVETGLRCMLRAGNSITLALDVKNWPEHGVLTFRARDLVRVGGDTAAGGDERLEWLLLRHVSRSMGVAVERVGSQQETGVVLEFPRTIRQLEGLTALEIDGMDPSRIGSAKPLAGRRLLLISPDKAIRDQVQMVCREMGISLDSCPTVRQAVRYCELEKPDGILVDESLRDKPFEELRADLLHYQPNFPFIEIAAGANVVEVSSWMSDTMTRLSRDALGNQLGSILLLELSKSL